MIRAIYDSAKAEWSETLRMMRGSPPAAPDEETLIRRAAEADRIRQFLESDVVTGFMAKQEAQLVEKLTSLPLEDDNGRMRMAVAVQSMRQLRKYLTAAVQDGRMAERELERLRDGKRRYF